MIDIARSIIERVKRFLFASLQPVAVVLLLTASGVGNVVAANACFGAGGGSENCLCVPESTSVGIRSGPPNWWDSAATQTLPDVYTKLEDPRWNGAAAASLNDSTKDVNTLWAIHHEENNVDMLYLSFRIDVPNSQSWTPDPSKDQVRIAFERKLGAIGVKTLMTLKLSGEPGNFDGTANLSTARDYAINNLVGASGTTNLHVDTGSISSGVTTLSNELRDRAGAWAGVRSGTEKSYALQIRIPVSELSPIAGTGVPAVPATATTPEIPAVPAAYNVWIEMAANDNAGNVLFFHWPTATLPIGATSAVREFPGLDSWGTLQLVDSANSTACLGGGIYMASQDISTGNIPEFKVRYRTDTSAPPVINAISARVHNSMTRAVDASKLHAKFRLANWGSQPTDPYAWEADPTLWNRLWRPIVCAPTDPTNTVSIPGLVAGVPGVGAIQCDWEVPAADVLEYEAGTRPRDQCMFVELSDANGNGSGGFTYRSRSAARNLDFRSASQIRVPAEITIAGLKPISPKGRDVYVEVIPSNMPKFIRSTPVSDGPVAGAQGQTNRDGPSRVDRRLALLQGIASGKLSAAELSRLEDSGQLSSDELDAAVPTFKVRVFHDSGLADYVNQDRVPILTSQGTFGFRAVHAGPVVGWRYRLEFDRSSLGPDQSIEELAPNYFRIRNVPNEGVVRAVAFVEAIEPKRWSFGIYGGRAMPKGLWSNSFDSGPLVSIAIEYHLNSTHSLQAVVGSERFAPKGPGSDLSVRDVGLAYKGYLVSAGAWRAFATAGVTSYSFDPGPHRSGLSAGAGLQYEFSPEWSAELSYNLHRVSGSAPRSDFSTWQAGLRYSF